MGHKYYEKILMGTRAGDLKVVRLENSVKESPSGKGKFGSKMNIKAFNHALLPFNIFLCILLMTCYIRPLTAGVQLRPFFSKILAWTTFVHFSNPGAKNPSLDEFLGIYALFCQIFGEFIHFCRIFGDLRTFLSNFVRTDIYQCAQVARLDVRLWKIARLKHIFL